MSRRPQWTIAILALLGCAASTSTLQTLSAGHVGCRSKDIEIRDHEKNFASETWTAVCRGDEFYCVNRMSDMDGGSNITCSEAR